MQQLRASLHDVELDRVHIVSFMAALDFFIFKLGFFKIDRVLYDYANKLKQVAYLLFEDVDRLIEREGFSANMDILANKRNYINIYTHFMTGKKATQNKSSDGSVFQGSLCL